MGSMLDDWTDGMRGYRTKRDAQHQTVASKYNILGFISSGTYGRVYKAQAKSDDGRVHAIKKFKPDKEGEVPTYTGISQSAIREIALNREISHENIVALKEVILEDKSIYMVFEYAEHDFLQVIHHHSQTLRQAVPPSVLKSLIWQLLNGLVYLHSCHILHRDLKPANILITAGGVVKIGDLGLARLIYQPLQHLSAGDKVVVTIWYRAPELLMGRQTLQQGGRHMKAKLDSKKNVPFQRDQLLKIFEVLGTIDEREWPSVKEMPEYHNMKRLEYYPNGFSTWCSNRLRSPKAQDFLRQLFAYSPDTRLTAEDAIYHEWFREEPLPTLNAFQGVPSHQIPPHRRITQDDAPSTMMPGPGLSHAQASHQVQLAQYHQQHSGKQGTGSAPSFASGGAPSGHHGGSRKKARMG